ncbi:MAG: hypothetical protein PHR00_03980 [Patescibacteria group bacterium]|nr:hypothetical protein [Patescibacteria group bacterium]
MLNKKIAAMSILTMAAITAAPLTTQAACGCSQKLKNGTSGCANTECSKNSATCACNAKKITTTKTTTTKTITNKDKAKADLAKIEAKRQAVNKAIEANDYKAWVAAEGSTAPIVKIITLDKFPKYIELYNLEKQVKQLRDVLGLNTMKPGLSQTTIVK